MELPLMSISGFGLLVRSIAKSANSGDPRLSSIRISLGLMDLEHDAVLVGTAHELVYMAHLQ
jgi:hypothetical protein